VRTNGGGACAVIRDVPEQLPQASGPNCAAPRRSGLPRLLRVETKGRSLAHTVATATGPPRTRIREGAVSVRQRRGRSGLTPSSVFHRVPTAPSTEPPRLMASQVAVASANVSSVVGRGRNRLGAFLRLSRRARTRVSRRSRGRCSRGAEPGPVPRDLAVCAAPTRRASRCRRSRPP
jgi:hypothetical protein